MVDYVGPQVDGGRFPIKRAVGETVKVVAHAFADGHDSIRMEILYRKQDQSEWAVREMEYEVNDEWSAQFAVAELGGYFYTVRGWVDRFGTWQSDLQKKFAANQDVTIELRAGAVLLRDTAAARRARGCDEAGRLGGTLRGSGRTGAARSKSRWAMGWPTSCTAIRTGRRPRRTTRSWP